mmetsp:Transcript_4265/g.7102  ORF Transcript_4265/g.7102 Transcript_4265/m.7102 type:complete len:87 (-) Transcript_4265:196-456(-)
MVTWLGFLCYANVGGLNVQNVAVVTVMSVLYASVFYPGCHPLIAAGCTALLPWVYFPIWPAVALVFTIMEFKLGDYGSTDETTNLV